MSEETLALNVVIDGFAKFSLGMQAMDAAINIVGKAWDALSGPAVAAVDAAADFESQMADLSIAARSTGLELTDLEQAALAVGGASDLVGVSASDAAKSMTGLFKAGLSTTEIFGDFNETMEDGNKLGGALRAAIDLAAASELDMVQASDLAAIALASFGGELETEAERAEFINVALNNMVKAADASVAEVSGLADALVNVGPKASALGISIQDTNNALAILSTRGIQGATAGTNLRSMLDNLFRDTKPVQEAIATLGLQLFDTNGEFVGLRSVVEQLQTAFKGATDEEKAYFTQQLAGTFGQNALNALLAEGAEGWDAMADATDKAAGITEQAAAKSATYKGRLEALEGVVETLQIRIGNALLPILTDFVTLFTTFIEDIGPDVERTLERIEPLFDELSSQIKIVFDNLMSLIGGGTGLIEFFGNMEPAVFGISKTLFEMGMIVKELAQDIAIFIAGALTRFGEWFEENDKLILEFIAVIVDGFKEAARSIKRFWQLIKPVLEALGELLLDIFTLIMQVVVQDWEGAWETIQQIVADAWVAIQELFVFFIEWVASWFNSDVARILGMWRDNWEQFKTILGLAWDAMIAEIIANAKTMRDEIVAGITAIGTWISDNVQTFIDWGKSIVEKIKEGIDSLISNIPDAIKDGITAIGTMIGTMGQTLLDFGKSIVDKIAEGIGNSASAIGDAITGILSGIGSAVSFTADILSQLGGIGLGIVKGIAAGITSGVSAIVDAIRQMVVDAVQALFDAIDFLALIRDALGGGGGGGGGSEPEDPGVLTGPGSFLLGAQSQVSPIGGSAQNTSNTNTVNNNFNLTTQSLLRPGGLEMEFEAMSMATR